MEKEKGLKPMGAKKLELYQHDIDMSLFKGDVEKLSVLVKNSGKMPISTDEFLVSDLPEGFFEQLENDR